jgi:hypothetical protein
MHDSIIRCFLIFRIWVRYLMSSVIDAGYSGAVERNEAERIHVAAAHKVIEEAFNNKRDQWVYSQTVSRCKALMIAAAAELDW